MVLTGRQRGFLAGVAGLLLAVALGCSWFGVETASAAVRFRDSGWLWGSPWPTGDDLGPIAMVGRRGYAVESLGQLDPGSSDPIHVGWVLLRSDDGGVRWRDVWHGGSVASPSGLQAMGPETVLVTDCSLLRSDDAGRSFRTLRVPGVSLKNCVLAATFATPQVGYVLRADGTVLSTDDGGRSFLSRGSVPGVVGSATGEPGRPVLGGSGVELVLTPAPNGLPPGAAPPSALLVLYTGTVFEGPSLPAVSTSYLYRSTDGARSWVLVAQSASPLNSLAFSDPLDGYLVGGVTYGFDPGPATAVLRTSDGGASWSAPAALPLNGGAAVACSSSSCLLLATSGHDDGCLHNFCGYLHYSAVYRSTDGFATVTPTATAEDYYGSGSDIGSIAFGSPTQALAVGRNGGVYVSGDGGARFETASGGIGAAGALVGGGSPGSAFALSGDSSGGGFARTRDGGRTWTALALPYVDASTPALDGSFSRDGTGYVLDEDFSQSTGRFFDRLLATSDSGDRWRSVLTTRDGVLLGICDLGGRRVLSVGRAGVSASRDAGRRFAIVLRARGLEAFSHARGVLAAYGVHRIAVSIDRGDRWRSLPVPARVSISSLQFVTRSVAYLLTRAGRMLRSSDGGQSWRRLRIGRHRARAMSFADSTHGLIDVSDPDRYSDFAQSETYGTTELLATADGGRRWTTERLDSSDGPNDLPGSSSLLALSRTSAIYSINGNLLWTDTGGRP